MHNSDPACIGIVGGGFSGVLVLANLVHQATSGFTVELFEAHGPVQGGVVYGTPDVTHLLNVRADRMGAWVGQPGDFYRWLQTVEGKAQTVEIWPGRTVNEASFVPRALYGAYLQQLWAETLAQAQAKGITVRVNQAAVVDAVYKQETQQLLLAVKTDTTQRTVAVDALVLATGNVMPRRFAFEAGLHRCAHYYIPDVWRTPPGCLYPHQVAQLAPETAVVIIGTGLTMVDNVLTLQANGYRGTIYALSRHGWLPATHAPAKPYPAWALTTDPDQAPTTVLGLLKALRAEVKQAAALGYDWRSVVDSLRPVTQTLWQRLSVAEKRKFINKLLSLWNIHRHRMAPEICEQVTALQRCGQLQMIAGQLYHLDPTQDGLEVVYRRRQGQHLETLQAALVLNCTGPEYDIATSDHRLLKNLRDRKLVTVGPLRMGIESDGQGSAAGQAPGLIFPIGALLVGELLECTAVPELREQARKVAGRLLNRVEQIKQKREPVYEPTPVAFSNLSR